MFVTIDGIDGAGKSTQLDRLCNWLQSQGREVEFVRDPGSTPAGEAIRGLLLDSDLDMHRRCEAMLYMAARTQLVEERIRPALAAGKTVVSDRYLLANVVYQSAGGQIEPDLLWRLGDIATAGLMPDLTILLDIAPEVAAERRSHPDDRMERRGIGYFQQVRDGFLEQLTKCPGTTVVVDANQAIDEVWLAIQTAVQTAMEQEGNSHALG